MNHHKPEPLYLSSHLFTVRLWREPAAAAAEHGEIRMQVRHLASGETRYFRDWQALIAYLEAQCDRPEQEARGQ